MKKYKQLIAVIIFILIAASLSFYYVVMNREDTEFKEGIAMPRGIIIGEKKIDDEVVAKTLVMEIQRVTLEKATKYDMNNINDNDRAFLIQPLYEENAVKSGQLVAIEVLKDGTFVASKNVNGRLQYVKGQFSTYTMDYFTALHTLQF
ncbi:MAG: hypothetical protein K0R80_794 [Clostridia bacterium]|jgi:hypothetical protein|nr:hypothetical protein [Clostridia bacterium]